MRNMRLITMAAFIGTCLIASSCSNSERGKMENQADHAADKMEQSADKMGRKAGEAADKAGNEMSEAATTTAVKTKLAADVRLSTLTSINVDTNGHTVTLTGSVPNATDKSNAETVARTVDGVTSVVNNLIVKP